MKSISLFVPGLPVAQPRPRAVSFRGHARMYSPKTSDQWKACVIHAFQNHSGTFAAGTPVKCYLTFAMPRPRSHYGSGKNADTLKPSAPVRPTSKPDLDNLAKAVTDAMTAAGVWADDSQVTLLSLCKQYATTRAGCQITILEDLA